MPRPTTPTLTPYTSQLPDVNNPATWAERTPLFWNWVTGPGYTNLDDFLTYSEGAIDYVDAALAGSETVVDAVTALQADVTVIEAAYIDRGDFVGAVSQSGGVPTGAIIERGSNANGEYVKFADGTVICVIDTIAVSASVSSGSIFTGVGTVWTLPTALASPVVAVGGGRIFSTFRWVTVSEVTTTTARVQLLASISTGSVDVSAWVIGRWF